MVLRRVRLQVAHPAPLQVLPLALLLVLVAELVLDFSSGAQPKYILPIWKCSTTVYAIARDGGHKVKTQRRRVTGVYGRIWVAVVAEALRPALQVQAAHHRAVLLPAARPLVVRLQVLQAALLARLQVLVVEVVQVFQHTLTAQVMQRAL